MKPVKPLKAQHCRESAGHALRGDRPQRLVDLVDFGQFWQVFDRIEKAATFPRVSVKMAHRM